MKIRTSVRLIAAVAALSGSMTNAQTTDARIEVDAGKVLHRVSRNLTGDCIEDVNHEVYGGIYSQMLFGESFQEPPLSSQARDYVDGGPTKGSVSGMWRPWHTASAEGEYSIEYQEPFLGSQSQRITRQSGDGLFGIENQGLDHWGISFIREKSYEGYVWARAEKPVRLKVALVNKEGKICAEKKLYVKNKDWRRLDFSLKPDDSSKEGSFVIALEQPGSVVLGHAFLQPGEWGRFKGLPVRKDIVEALIAHGVTFMRYGGNMVNQPEYRWKKMIGPRDRRQPYRGWWYPYSSDGWGIFDFLNLCEAAGFVALPSIHLDETPQDAADLIEYVNGPATSEWGRRRSADGHPAPYHLKYLELGNEERVNEAYWEKFKLLAEAIWAKDPDIVLVVGDFSYDKVITNPYKFTGSPVINTLSAHKKILELAAQHNREILIDVHVNTERPPLPDILAPDSSFLDQLHKLCPEAKVNLAILELNAGNHALKRALANALALNAIERDGRVLLTSSANCLQPDGHNDNGWDQGLVFFNPSQVWLQPPAYVTRMISRNYQPLLVASRTHGTGNELDVTASRSDDGKTLVLQIVNTNSSAISATIHLDGFVPSKPTAALEQLAGDLDATNTAENPDQVKPILTDWHYQLNQNETTCNFPANSFTVIRFE